MLRSLVVLALFGVAAAQPAAPPKAWPLQEYVRWQPEWGARTVDASGLRARIEVKRCGVDRPESEGCGGNAVYLIATVNAAGMQPTTITGEPGVAAFVGVGKLTPNAKNPSLIIISDDGGSGGCVQIDLAVPTGNAYQRVRLSADKNDHGTLCMIDPAKLAWPENLTRRGRPEFLVYDTSLSCHFTSCAGSWYPPRVIAFDGRRGIDVSADPALAPLYRADMAKARQACEHDTREAQGACAGYAIDAARLGRLPEAWRVIAAQVHRGCRVPVVDVCPDANRIPVSFPTELATLLRRVGYL
jgi:hypothetical protein